MANEVLKLSILLDLKNQASPGVKTFIADLKRLDKQGTVTLATLKKIRSELSRPMGGKFGTSAVSMLNKMRTAANQTNSALDKTRNKLNRQMTTGKNGRSVINPNAMPVPMPTPALPADTPRPRRNLTTFQRAARFNDRVLEPGRQSYQAWKSQIDSLKEYTDETMKLYRAQEKFRLLNLSPEENKKAFEGTKKAVHELGITTESAGVETLTDLVNTLGNVDAALTALPMASKYRFSMNALLGDDFNEAQISKQIQTAFQFLELTNKVSQGREKMMASFDTITKISSATAGRVSGAELLQMAKRGGPAVSQLSDEGLRNLSAVIDDMGGSQVGTAQMTMYQALVGGRMRQKSAERFRHFGLLDESKIEFGNAQQIKRLLPGANKLAPAMMEDPLKAADMLREAMAKQGVDVNNAKAVNEELSILFGDRTGFRLMSKLMNDRAQIVKESERAKNAKGIESRQTPEELAIENAERFKVALTNFKTEAGIPLIATLTELSKAAIPVLKWFGDHPTVAKYTMAVLIGGKVFSAFAETASLFARTGPAVTSWFTNATAAAETNAGAITRAGTAATTTGGKIAQLRGKLNGLPSIVKIGISLAALDFTWEMIQFLRETAAKETNQQMANATANQQAAQITETQKKTDAAMNWLGFDKEKRRKEYRAMGMNDNTIDQVFYNPKRTAADLNQNLGGGRNEIAKSLDTSKKDSLDLVRDLGRIFTNKSVDWQPMGPIPADIVAKQSERKAFYEKQGPRDAKNTTIDYLISGLVPALAPVMLNRSVNPNTLTNREQRGAAYFREQAPQLKDPEVMRAFRTNEMPKMGLDANATADLNNMLKLAFPESFAASSQAVATNFQSMVAPIANATTGLTSIYDPLIQTGGAFMAITPTVQPLADSFSTLPPYLEANQNSLIGMYNASRPVPPSFLAVSYAGIAVSNSLVGVSSSLQNVSSQLANWKAPQAAPVASGTPAIITPDSNAKGGSVVRSGLSYIHKGEKVVPSRTVAFHDNIAPRLTSAVAVMRSVVEAPPVAPVINIFNAPVSPINALGSTASVQTAFANDPMPNAANSPYSVNAMAIPGFAKGADRVQRDGLAFIHTNERIVPAKATAYRDRQELSTIENLSANAAPSVAPVVESAGNYSEGNIYIDAPATFNFPKGIEKVDSSRLEAVFQPLLTKHQKHIERLVERSMQNGRLRN